MSTASFDVAALLTQLVTWALVVGGWWFVHVATARRARRTEELEPVRHIRERVLKLRDRAVSYYTTSADEPDRATEAHLKYEVQSLIATTQLLRTRKPGRYDMLSEQAALRAAVTGGPFESVGRKALLHTDPIVQRLWLISDRFLLALQEEFEKANPN